MNIWKDKSGKKIGTKEFFSRWKSGIQSVTQLQMLKSSLMGYIIIFIGFIWGIIFSFTNKQYWLVTILCGGLIIQLVGFIGVLQKYLFEVKMRNLHNEEGGDIL